MLPGTVAVEFNARDLPRDGDLLRDVGNVGKR